MSKLHKHLEFPQQISFLAIHFPTIGEIKVDKIIKYNYTYMLFQMLIVIVIQMFCECVHKCLLMNIVYLWLIELLPLNQMCGVVSTV